MGALALYERHTHTTLMFGRAGCCHYTENKRRDVSNITYCSDSSETVHFMKEGI